MFVSSLTCVLVAAITVFLSGCGGGAPAPGGRSFKNIRLGDQVALKKYLDEIESDIKTLNQLEIGLPTDHPVSQAKPAVVHVVPRASGVGVDSLVVSHAIEYTASILYFMLAPYGQGAASIADSGLVVSWLAPAECRSFLHGVFLSYEDMDRDIVHTLFAGSDYLQGDRQTLVSLEAMEGFSLSNFDSLRKGFVVHSVSMAGHDATSSEGVNGYRIVTVDCVRVSIPSPPLAAGADEPLTGFIRFLKPRSELILKHWKSMDDLKVTYQDPTKFESYVRDVEGSLLSSTVTGFRAPSPLSKVEAMRPQFVHSALCLSPSTEDESLTVRRASTHVPALLFKSYEYIMAFRKGASLAGGPVIKRDVLTDAHCRASLDGVFLYASALHGTVHLPVLFPELVDPSNTGLPATPSARWPSPARARVLISTRFGESLANDDSWQKSKGLILVAIDLDSNLIVPGKSSGVGGVLTEAVYSSARAFCVRLSPIYEAGGKAKEMNEEDDLKIYGASKVAVFKTNAGRPGTGQPGTGTPSNLVGNPSELVGSSSSADLATSGELGKVGVDLSVSKLDLSLADVELLTADALAPTLGASEITDDFMEDLTDSGNSLGDLKITFPSDIANRLNVDIDIFDKEAVAALLQRLNLKSLYLSQREAGYKVGSMESSGTTVTIESIRLDPSVSSVPLAPSDRAASAKIPLLMFESGSTPGGSRPSEVSDEKVVCSDFGSAGSGKVLTHKGVSTSGFRYTMARIARHTASLTEAAAQQKLEVKLVDGRPFLQTGLFVKTYEVANLARSFLSQFMSLALSRVFEWSHREYRTVEAFLLPLSEVECPTFGSPGSPKHICLLLTGDSAFKDDGIAVVEFKYAFFCFQVRAVEVLQPTARICPAVAGQPIVFTGDPFKKEDVERFVHAADWRAVHNHLVETPTFSTSDEANPKRPFTTSSFRLNAVPRAIPPPAKTSIDSSSDLIRPLIVSSASPKVTSMSFSFDRLYASERVTEYIDLLGTALVDRKVHVARVPASHYFVDDSVFFSMSDVWGYRMRKAVPERFTGPEFSSKMWQDVLEYDEGYPIVRVSDLESYTSPDPKVRKGPKIFCFLISKGSSRDATTDVLEYENVAVDCFRVTITETEVYRALDFSTPSAELTGPINWNIDVLNKEAVKGLVSVLEQRTIYQLWKADHGVIIEDYTGKRMNPFSVVVIRSLAPAKVGDAPELDYRTHEVPRGYMFSAFEEYSFLLEDLCPQRPKGIKSSDTSKEAAPVETAKFSLTKVDSAPFLANGLFYSHNLSGLTERLNPELRSKEEYARRGWTNGSTYVYLPLLDVDLHISADPKLARAPKHVCFLLEDRSKKAAGDTSSASKSVQKWGLECYSVTIPDEFQAAI